ncbi:NACHT and ankyrin domain protein [Paraphoma chrysanthemicola]|nr:NACHT and ankyrin domain protein [Paraphoma chrysanthemicola]
MSIAPSQLSIGQDEDGQNWPRASDNCRHELFVSDPYTDRETLINLKGTRVDGTCLWITKHEKYLAWLRDHTHLLWISGGPGKGKTMISIFLSQELENVEKQSIPHELIFFFCSQGDTKRNTALGILRSLIYQILSKSPQLVKHAEEYFATPERTAQTLSSLDSLWIIFTRSIDDPEFPPTRCVIDGLDECDKETRRQLIAKLLNLYDTTDPKPTHPAFPTKLSLAVISRTILELRGCTEIKIDPDNNQSTTDDGMTAEVRNHVESTLRARAQGTFLWVGFAMHELLQQDTCSDILDTLSRIPTGLSAIYSRMLSQILPDRRKLSKDILDWVTMATRPLKLRELAAAVDIKPASSLIDEEHAVRDAVSACGPFLKIDDEVITLVHQSARDYLLRETPDDDSVLESFRIKPNVTHLKIAQTCFECILLYNLYLAQHGGELHDHIHNELLFYSGSNEPFRDYKPLNIAAIEGHEHAVEYLIDHGAQVDSGEGQSPLYHAVQMGHPSTVALLLRRGAKTRGESIIHAYVFSGAKSMEIWKMLVRHKIDIHESLGQKGTNLHFAAGFGLAAPVKLLIEQGIEVNATDDKGYTALHVATRKNNVSVVEVLLANGADPGAETVDGDTALDIAVRRHNRAVIQVLENHATNLRNQETSSTEVSSSRSVKHS